MSIATLKKKTQAKYNNMSVGSKHGFSLNGTHRSQGFVGQTSLSRSLPRTLMRGNVMRGHGGCCGTYPQHSIIQSAVTSTEDTSVLKSSVVDTAGMLAMKYRWILRPAPYASVKPGDAMNNNGQEDYIQRLRKNTIKEAAECYSAPTIKTTCNSEIKSLFTRTHIQPVLCDTTKPGINTVSQGEYLIHLDNQCAENDVVMTKKSTSNTPFGC